MVSKQEEMALCKFMSRLILMHTCKKQFKGGLMVSKQQEMGFCKFMSRLILMLKLIFLLRTSVFPLVQSYDILFVHNMGTRSHLITLKPIVEELLRRNHSVTSIFFQVFWLLLFSQCQHLISLYQKCCRSFGMSLFTFFLLTLIKGGNSSWII